MKVLKNVSLKFFNTFKFDVTARYLSNIKNTNDIYSALEWAEKKKISCIPLGSGSNLLLEKDINALVIIMETSSIKILKKKPTSALVQVDAGYLWDDFVYWSLRNKLYGLENLSLIPGTVGAAPIQNIGAYGIELKDNFFFLTAINIQNKVVRNFYSHDCQFGYRDSIFKNREKDKWIILSVTFKLDTNWRPKLNYGNLENEFFLNDRKESITALNVRDFIIQIRKEKLPDPKKIGNAGSFFKNPVIPHSQFIEIKHNFPDLLAFSFCGHWKISAGWLIEKAGFKGYRYRSMGVYNKQALVIVNYNSGTPKQLIWLVNKIKTKILQMFGILLEIEPISI